MNSKHRPALRSAALAISLALLILLTPAAEAGEPVATDSIPGVALELELILDSFKLIEGGVSSGSALLGKTALTLDVDTTEARLWTGGRILVQVMGTFGDEPSALAGDLQVLDNIEAGDDLGVLEAWVEQSLGTRASLLVGYHDLNREFDVIESAGELLNSSFGIGPEISQLGPSIFPQTHLGARLELRPTSDTWVKIAGYDGLEYRDADGSHYAIESGWQRDRLGPLEGLRVAAGAWRLDPDAGSVPSASGAYVLAEATRRTGNDGTIAAFVRLGATNDDRQPIERYIGAGVRLGHILPGRPDDVIAFGIAHAGLAETQRHAAETTFELTWLAQLHDRIAVQPDLQYIDHPAGEPGIDHALVTGLRLIITY